MPKLLTKSQAQVADLLSQWRADPMLFYRTQIILENGKPLGECWDDWQCEDYQGWIEHQHAMLLRPRGHDKTGMAGSTIVYDLVTGPRGMKIYSAASDQAQANLLLDD